MLLLFFVFVDGTNGPNEDEINKQQQQRDQYVKQLDRTGFVNKGFIRRKSFIVRTTRESRAGKIG